MRSRTLRWLAPVASVAVGAAVLATAVAQESATTLRTKGGDHAFQVVVTPAAPKVGHQVMVQLDLNQVPAVPDPTFGDRLPVKGASLVAVLAAKGATGEKLRYSMHPLGAAGRYGFHWTPTAKGLHQLTFERRGGELPAVAFEIGVEVETPRQDDSAAATTNGPLTGGLPRQRLDRPGVAVHGPVTPVSAGPTAQSVMTAMSEPAGLLSERLAAGAGQDGVTPLVAALVAETKKLPGTVPDKYRVAEADYEGLVKELETAMTRLSAAAEAGDHEKTKAEWRSLVDGTCTRCHVKFWWAVTPDLESWPQVTARPWKR